MLLSIKKIAFRPFCMSKCELQKLKLNKQAHLKTSVDFQDFNYTKLEINTKNISSVECFSSINKLL